MSATHILYRVRLGLMRLLLRWRRGQVVYHSALRVQRVQLRAAAQQVQAAAIADFEAEMAYANSLLRRAERIDDLLARRQPHTTKGPSCA